MCLLTLLFLFFFNDTATTEIYTLSLHDALPIFGRLARGHLDLELVGPLFHASFQRVVGLLQLALGLFAFRDQEAQHRVRSEEHTSELQSPCNLVCRLLLEKKNKM